MVGVEPSLPRFRRRARPHVPHEFLERAKHGSRDDRRPERGHGDRERAVQQEQSPQRTRQRGDATRERLQHPEVHGLVILRLAERERRDDKVLIAKPDTRRLRIACVGFELRGDTWGREGAIARRRHAIAGRQDDFGIRLGARRNEERRVQPSPEHERAERVAGLHERVHGDLEVAGIGSQDGEVASVGARGWVERALDRLE